MKRLWFAIIVIATLGSIYPFDFQSVQIEVETLRSMLHSCCTRPGRGDVLGNIVLFLPFGFVGMFAVRPDATLGRRLAFLVLIALVFATALQMAQIYLPSRDESLQDVIWNLVGTAAGALLAMLAFRHSPYSEDARLDADIVPLALIATWLAYRLMPFVPSIDYQLIKNSVKPLFDPDLTFGSIVPDVAAWIVTGYLLRAMRPEARMDRFLPALIIVVLILEVFIVDNVLHASDVFAAVLAVIACPMLLRSSWSQEVPLVVLLLLGVLLAGLSPFTFVAHSGDFNWLPFHGFLSGSMYLNTLSAAQKVFVFGSLVFLLRKLSLGYVVSIGLVFIVVFTIELAQTRLVGHTPEITDPMLVLLAAVALVMLSDKSSGTAPTLARQHERTMPKVRSSGFHDGQWVAHTVSVSEEQLRFVELLANEMNVSVSRTARRIVANFIKDSATQASGHSGAMTESRGFDAQATRKPDKLVRLPVNLRRTQLEWLTRESDTLGLSVSQVMHHIIENFTEQLEDEPSIGPGKNS